MRRVLFDENVPRQLRRELPNFVIQTVQEEGWAGLKNGALLREASSSFDALLTADQRLRHQQNISRFAIGIVVVETYDTRIRNLRRFLSDIEEALGKVAPGEIIIISEPDNS